ncbi:transcription factor IIIA [Eurosta solidaginis]|uniref:transcription factor IIIA n=1 Tax=Eurosta solidaginis TaxID=178769 RepID=UPI0035315B20
MTPGHNANSDSDLESVISFKDTVKPRRNSTGPKYFCSIQGCGQSFKRLDHLDRHEYHHTGVKKHICIYDGCDKNYSILTHLKRHFRTTHERVAKPEKNVTCQIPGCLKMFQTETNMLRHIRQVHEKPKIYACTSCEEKFTQKLKLRRHEIQRHTGDYPYTCDKCSRGFYQQWQHDRHVRSCKVYICAVCTLQFDKWTNYQKHCKEQQHLRKYYQCEHCERVYSKPSDLKKHIAAKHMTEEMQMVYKCAVCERCYAYERNLKQHMRVAHDGKRFQCSMEQCERIFSSAQNLNKHLKREHHDDSTKCEVPSNTQKKKNEKSSGRRKKRKDAGKSIMSNLTKFSGLVVDREFDKLLREREDVAIEMAGNALVEDQSGESDDGEADTPLAKFFRVDGIAGDITSTTDGVEPLLTAVLVDI